MLRHGGGKIRYAGGGGRSQIQKAVSSERLEGAGTVAEEKIGRGKIMTVGERTEGEEVEVRGRINGGEELHYCGSEAQSGRSGAIIEFKGA